MLSRRLHVNDFQEQKQALHEIFKQRKQSERECGGGNKLDYRDIAQERKASKSHVHTVDKVQRVCLMKTPTFVVRFAGNVPFSPKLHFINFDISHKQNFFFFFFCLGDVSV